MEASALGIQLGGRGTKDELDRMGKGKEEGGFEGTERVTESHRFNFERARKR